MDALVSTRAMNWPSIDTLAMPVPNPRSPIQRTDVPVNVNVARSPTITDCRACSPLQKLENPACVQPAVNATDGSGSCRRVTLGAGTTGTTSNASPMTHAADDAVFFWPVTSILNV